MLTETDYSHCEKAVPLYAQLSRQCIVHRQWRVCLAFSSRVQILTVSADENFFFSAEHLLFSTTEIYGFFQFPTRLQISLRCPDTRDQIHRTITLYGTGILHNTSVRHITSDEITIFPDLHGTSLAELDSPKFYLPDNISIVTSDEIQQPKDISPTDIQKLHDMHTKVATLQQTFDVDSLLHIHRTTMLHKQNTHWFIIITTSFCATLILGTLCLLFYFRFHYILRIIPKPNNTTCTSSSLALAIFR